ncbi:MAG: hypothetical protein R2824_00860 [Saprospiraceae bacterium]|nr:hypothetical protein [Lewinella sp.]
MTSLKILFLTTFTLASFIAIPVDHNSSVSDPNDPENTFYVLVTFEKKVHQPGSIDLTGMKNTIDSYNAAQYGDQKLMSSTIYLESTEFSWQPIVIIRRFSDEAKARSYSGKLNVHLSSRPDHPKSMYLTQQQYRSVIKANNFDLLGK